MNIGFSEDDIIMIDTEGETPPSVYVNGIHYTANGHPVKVFRAVQDNDGDMWIEVGDGAWRLMKFDSLRKDGLQELAEKHGPLVTE
jgi:hypothetical protein